MSETIKEIERDLYHQLSPWGTLDIRPPRPFDDGSGFMEGNVDIEGHIEFSKLREFAALLVRLADEVEAK